MLNRQHSENKNIIEQELNLSKHETQQKNELLKNLQVELEILQSKHLGTYL